MTGKLYGSARSCELRIRPNEDSDLGGSGPVGNRLLDPVGNARNFTLRVMEREDFRIGAVENRHSAAPILLISIHVLHNTRQEPVSRLSDLMRGSVIDL